MVGSLSLLGRIATITIACAACGACDLTVASPPPHRAPSVPRVAGQFRGWSFRRETENIWGCTIAGYDPSRSGTSTRGAVVMERIERLREQAGILRRLADSFEVAGRHLQSVIAAFPALTMLVVVSRRSLLNAKTMGPVPTSTGP